MKASYNSKSAFWSVIFGGDSSSDKTRSISLSKRKTRQRSNKRSFRADVLSLLTSALRPRLLRCGGCALLVCFVFICCQNAYTFSVSAASITLSLPDTLSLMADSTNENGFSKSAPATIKVNTDADSGYVLSIKSKDSVNKNTLTNGEFRLPSIDIALTEGAYKTGDYINTWGFLPSKLNGVENTEFQPGPTDEELVLDNTESATDGDASYDITIASKINDSLPSGSYNNTFVVSAVANSTPEMQNWDGCDLLSIGRTIKMIDNRDSKEYHVAKLADGKCWMTDNLKLGGSSSVQLTTENSDVSSNWSLPAAGAISAFGSWSVPDDRTAHIYTDDGGNFYNWYAATAGGTNTDGTLVALSSICPKGWHLPTRMEFGDLMNNTNHGSTLMQAPNNFTDGGYLFDNEVNWQNEGYYWGSTMGSGTGSTYSSDDLNVYTSNALSGVSTNREGHRVRCISGPLQYKDLIRNYSINYNLNGGTLSESSNPQTGRTFDNTVALYNNSYGYPSRGGYEFLGWCTTDPGSDTSCSGEFYDNNNTTLNLEDEIENYTLYAVWKSYPVLDSSSCSNMETPKSGWYNAKPHNYNDRTAYLYRYSTGTCVLRQFEDARYDGNATWSQAYNGCPSGYHLPSISECMQSWDPSNDYSSYCGINFWTTDSARSGYHYSCSSTVRSECYVLPDTTQWSYACMSN